MSDALGGLQSAASEAFLRERLERLLQVWHAAPVRFIAAEGIWTEIQRVTEELRRRRRG